MIKILQWTISSEAFLKERSTTIIEASENNDEGIV
jgi:hypothetical protein